MTPQFPPATELHPLRLPDGTLHEGTVFLKAAINHPRIEVGEYSYASSFDPPDDWAKRLAPYLYAESAECLRIGKFCQIADGVCFITASANHRYDGFSSYPFAIFDDGGWEARASLPGPGPDTIIGHDVWIGQGARILPGSQIGNGCIIGAGAVVGGTIASYCVVVGNPATVKRRRFGDQTIARLQEIRWWDWPIKKIMVYEAQICGGDLNALNKAAEL